MEEHETPDANGEEPEAPERAEEAWEDPAEEWPDNVVGTPDPEQLNDPRDGSSEPVDPTSIDRDE